MKMNNYINDFTSHLKDALHIGLGAKLQLSNKQFHNILICGLGGSGIGGTILKDILSEMISIPIVSTKDYSIPGFVNDKTLVIVSSYSGNTEETLFALKKCVLKKAEICIITSGGKLLSMAKEKNYNHIIIPKGHPPRAMFGYSFTQLFFILNHYNIISDFFISDFRKTITLLNAEKETIKKEAQKTAEKLFGQTPVIYVANGFEGVATRFRQQINENSKMLCWHHVIPEMNHNELLGWRTNVSNLAVIYFRNQSDYNRNQRRIDINKDILLKYTKNIIEIWSKGKSSIEKSLYHIHLGDWISWYLSELNKVDAVEIDVINFLKTELDKI
tara:strand:+ start:196 stop:1185 length:990 start_codon:yes stop_codon:yes gene_type:complete